MLAQVPAISVFTLLGRNAARWLVGWWRIVHFGAVVGVMALSPGSYSRPQQTAIARHMVLDTAPVLVWFTLLSSLLSVVISRIVVVTALSYGLTQYALEMLVRVLVIEIIPLTAALFVAVRCTMPHGEELAAMRLRGELNRMRDRGLDPMRHEVLPRAVAGLFSVAMLSVLAGAVALVLAYLATYGFTLWALEGYTRTVGRVFSPTVVVVFLLKTLLFSLAVVLVPMGSALYDPTRSRMSVEVRGLVRLFALVLLIEAGSLAVNIL
ncbi:MAG TPA: ABC transporter permease [Burkholderiaceae bacterium]|jgi:phospholipid/cholesterol/gamma-HCH transport system permease protein|nr:ABC transporter permease [Burkholderiaceae bacterium]